MTSPVKIGFDFSVGSYTGHCTGVSFAQALDHAKVAYLRASGFGITHPKFRLLKTELRERFFKLRTDQLSLALYKELYVGFREDALSEHQRAQLKIFSKMQKDRTDYERANAPRKAIAAAQRPSPTEGHGRSQVYQG